MARGGGRRTGAAGSHNIQAYLQPRAGEKCELNTQDTENGTSEKKVDENDGLVPFPKKRKKRNDACESPSKRIGEGKDESAVRTSKRLQEKRRKQAEEATELADGDDSSDSLQCSPGDLRKEAKVVDEEYAKLTAGKPLHPFFLIHKPSEQSNVPCKPRADSESLRSPSSPFHVTQMHEKTELELNWKCSFVERTPSCSQDTCQTSENFALTCQGAASTLVVSVQDCLFTSTPGYDSFSEIFNYLQSDALLSNHPSIEDLKDKYQEYEAMSAIETSSEHSNGTLNLLWTDIYKPRSAQQVCGNKASVIELNNWLSSWKLKVQSEKFELSPSEAETGSGTDSESWFQDDDDSDAEGEKKSCRLQNISFLSGPIGCGKSAAVYACAQEQGFEVIEINSSDVRTGAVIKHKIGEALESQSLDWFSSIEQAGLSSLQNRRMAMILFEEVDTLLDEDKGFMSALVELDKSAKRPIVLTSNKRKPVLPNLRRLEIKFIKPTATEMAVHATMVCLSRGILGSPWTMMRIVQASDQDLRKMMMLLQFCGQGGGGFQANKDEGGCLLKDSAQLFSATASRDGSTDHRNDPQAVWWFCSDAQFSMLPRLFSMSYPCSLTENVAARVSSAVQEAERRAMAVQVSAAVEAAVKRQSSTKRRARECSPSKSCDLPDQAQGGEKVSPCKSKARRMLKRLRRLNDLHNVEVSKSPPEVLDKSLEQIAVGVSTSSCSILQDEAPRVQRCAAAVSSQESSQEVQLGADPVKNRWLQLKRGIWSLECDCKSMHHQAALSVCLALAETADRLSSCDLISSSLDSFDLAAHLAQSSLQYVSDQLVTVPSLCEEPLSQTRSRHEQDMHRLNRQKLLKEELFYAKPKFAREGMTQAGFTDYTSFMARIVKLEEKQKSEFLRPTNRRSRGYQEDYFTQQLVSEEGVQALRELFNFAS